MVEKQTFTKTQRFFSDETLPGEAFDHPIIHPAHRSISNTKYVNLIRAQSYHWCQIGLRRKNDEAFLGRSNRIEEDES